MINKNSFAISCSITAGFLWLICSVLVVFIPESMMSMTGHMFHADLSNMLWTMTWSGFLTGLLSWVVVSGVTGLLLITIYNYLQSNQLS